MSWRRWELSSLPRNIDLSADLNQRFVASVVAPSEMPVARLSVAIRSILFASPITFAAQQTWSLVERSTPNIAILQTRCVVLSRQRSHALSTMRVAEPSFVVSQTRNASTAGSAACQMM